jgi:hypothetical protein
MNAHEASFRRAATGSADPDNDAVFRGNMVPVLSSGVGSGTNRAIGFVIIGGRTLVSC